MQPFLDLIRWDKPIGSWLLFWPGSWSIVLAAALHQTPLLSTLHLLALFFLGAIVMRSAGCIVNDMWDREFDAKVERTRNRPLASGAISMPQAFLLLFLLLLIALAIVVQLRIEVFWLALASLPLIITYPLMKRITWWPQAFLGLTFNFGALMGWVAVTGEIALPALLLYACGIFWTLGYDTIYAYQDIEDDLAIGVKSTAIRLQKHAKSAIALFYTISFLLYLAAFWASNAPFSVFLACFLPFLLLLKQVLHFNPQDKQNCGHLFKNSAWIGFALLIPNFLYLLVK